MKIAERGSSFVHCVFLVWFLVYTVCVYTQIPAMLSLYCSVSNFLSSVIKYCYFNYFRHVWSTPAVDSELLGLT